MPEIKFYISDKDRYELFDFMIENKIEIIPDLEYETPEYSTLEDKIEFIRIMEHIKSRFYLKHNSFNYQPLEYGYVKSRNKYFISQRVGGPLIDISFYWGFADDASLKIKSTEIDHYASYVPIDWKTNLDPDGYFHYFKAPKELKQIYNLIVKFLKSKCKNIKYGTKKYWVSKEFLDSKNELKEEYKGVMR